MTLARRRTLEDLQQLALSRGGWCLSGTFRNVSERLAWRCAQHHEWVALTSNVIKGSWCPTCSVIKRSDSLDMAQRTAAELGGKCLSAKHVPGQGAMEWQCSQGHRWKAPFITIKRGHWCRVCYDSRRRHTLEYMQGIAQERGGRCLSPTYIGSKTNLLWECAKGHHWQAAPHKIIEGRWCQTCAGHARRNTIENMQAIATQRGGRCLSEHYVDNTTKLHWICSLGHAWWTRPMGIVRGTWCPSCAHLARCCSNESRSKYLPVP